MQIRSPLACLENSLGDAVRGSVAWLNRERVSQFKQRKVRGLLQIGVTKYI